MPMELLARLCKAAMPCQVVDEDEIEKLVILRDARLVEAEIPPMQEEFGLRTFSAPARVHRVCEDGFAAVHGCRQGRAKAPARCSTP